MMTPEELRQRGSLTWSHREFVSENVSDAISSLTAALFDLEAERAERHISLMSMLERIAEALEASPRVEGGAQ
jgi:hypothetical protein